MNRLEKLASIELVKRLEDVGLAANYSDGSVTTGLSDLTITCLVEHIDNSTCGNFRSKVSFRACSDSFLSMTISTNGIAKSEEESVLEAVRSYTQHIWPVFRAALPPTEEIELKEEREKEELDSDVVVYIRHLFSLCDKKIVAWDVFLGPYRVESSRSDTLLAYIKKEHPIIFCMDSIGSYLNERRPHWVELKLAREDGDVSGFVSIDSTLSDEALRSLVDFPWPTESNGPESFSQFIMLCPSVHQVDESVEAEFEQNQASAVFVQALISCQDFSIYTDRELIRDLEILTWLLDRRAGTTDILKARAALYEALSDMDNAIADLTEAISLAPNDIDALHRRALVQMHHGNIEEGQQDLESAAALDKHDLRVRWGYAVLYMATQNYGRAKDELDDLIKENSESDYLYYYRAVCNHRVHDFDTAFADLNRAIALNPNYLDAYYERGHILIHMGDYERALSDFSRLALMVPNNVKCLEARASVYDKLDDHGSALEELKRLESLAPTRPTLFELRARILFKLEHYQESVAAASQAIELLPSLAEAYDLKSEALEKLSRHEEAKVERTKAEEAWLKGEQPISCHDVDWKEPSSIKRIKVSQITIVDPTKTFLHRGLLYQELGLHEKALVQFDNGLKREPLNSILLRARCLSFEAIGDWAKALADVTAVIALEPDEEDHYCRRGLIFTEQGELQKALDDFAHASKINPDNVQSHVGAAEAHMATEDYASAFKHYDRSIELAHAVPILHVPALYVQRALCLYELDRSDKAFEDLDEAIALNNKFARAYFIRGWLRSRMKQRAEAIKDFSTAIECAEDCNSEDCNSYYVVRAWEYYKLGDYESSERDCLRAINLDAEEPAPYDTLCRIKLESGEFDKALEIANQCIAISPEHPEIYDALSLCYAKMGKKAEARQARETAIELGFQDEDA
ncbi:hypothetical protein BH10CYA1_BH10CYA1_58260 [soil metagenome]